MDTLFKEMPGYRLNEYLVVLNPPEELRHKIHQVQQQFAEKYKTSVTLINSKPNIPLIKFTQYEMMEERMLSKLKLVAMEYHPVKIEMDNYGSFPSHTIFITVTTKGPIQELIKEIRTGTQRLLKMSVENKPQFFMEPHIPIARKLQPWQYEQGWQEFRHRHFTGRFIADSMLLLKRRKGTFPYQIIERLEFQNLYMPTLKQIDLFS